MADDICLPKLVWDRATDAIVDNRPRKRLRLSPPVSSDPPLFSSDDDPSADNYTQGRRKVAFRGPWYRQKVASASGSVDNDAEGSDFRKPRRPFERQFDSGIWLGSDGTDVDDDAGDLELQPRPTIDLPMRQPGTAQISQSVTPWPEQLAQKQIELCLETGNETIDLSSRDLTSLSNATIRPLAAFTCVPPVTEGVFARLEPMLKIFLASNRLSTLPGELFNLQHLTVLSLRGNKLHELPPAIGRLYNLAELNLSQNSLRYLPFEILDLFSDNSRLQSFQIHPNIFYEPRYPGQEPDEVRQRKGACWPGSRSNRFRRGAICGIPSDHSPGPQRRQWIVSYKARTEVRYLDINGAHMKGPILSNYTHFGAQRFSDGIPVASCNDTPVPPIPRGGVVSRVPSLLEVALDACSRDPQLPYLAAELPEDSPASFPGLLRLVSSKRDAGGTKCTMCNRDFIIPRTEWIEWWEIAKAAEKEDEGSAGGSLRQVDNVRDVVESRVPLIRRGCSWLCVPEIEVEDISSPL